jgi:hypothetical protein
MSVTDPTSPALPPSINREILMAATRKSAKRSSRKKRAAKGRTAKKRMAAKSGSKGRSKSSAKKAGGSKKRTSRGRSGRGPLNRVRAAGEKTWEALKSTTAQVVEGVKGTFGAEEHPNGR